MWAGPPTQRRGRRYSAKKTHVSDLIYKNDISSQSHAELQTLIVKSARPWPSHDTCVLTPGKHRAECAGLSSDSKSLQGFGSTLTVHLAVLDPRFQGGLWPNAREPLSPGVA